jgi:hypothetical protein
MKFQSKPMNIIEHESHCDVCRFLTGDRSPETMLKVIQVLDHQLHKQERIIKDCLMTIVSGDKHYASKASTNQSNSYKKETQVQHTQN